jgi:hypothetical protein
MSHFVFSVGAAEAPLHAAVQREGCVKIVSNETGLKKFLLNLFCWKLPRGAHFSPAANVLASACLIQPHTRPPKVRPTDVQ